MTLLHVSGLLSVMCLLCMRTCIGFHFIRLLLAVAPPHNWPQAAFMSSRKAVKLIYQHEGYQGDLAYC